MDNRYTFPRKLLSAPFSLKEAKAFGLSRYYLNKFIEEGRIEIVCRGVYRVSDQDYTEEAQFKVATIRVGEESAICLLSALSYYDLTDQIPRKTWIMVPDSKRTSFEELRLVRTRRPRWDTGIVKERGFSITSVERTIVDCLCYRRLIGTSTAVDALKRGARKNQRLLSKVIAVANELGVKHRIIAYVEAFS